MFLVLNNVYHFTLRSGIGTVMLLSQYFFILDRIFKIYVQAKESHNDGVYKELLTALLAQPSKFYQTIHFHSCYRLLQLCPKILQM